MKPALTMAAPLLLAPPAEAQRAFTAEEKQDLCGAIRPHYEKPPFDPREDGLRWCVNRNADQFSPLDRREAIGFDDFSSSHPDNQKRSACLSSSILAFG